MDLLPWDELVADGVLALVDGGLLRSFAFRGPDLDSSTPQEIESLAGTFDRALKLLGDGWAVYLEAQRHPAPPYPEDSDFPDPFTQALDLERRQRFDREDQYRSSYYLSLYHREKTPAMGLAERIHRMAVGRMAVGNDDTDREETHLAEFVATVSDLASLLSTAVEIRPLGSKELIRYLYRALTFRDHEIDLPDYPVSLEAIFGSGDLVAGLDLAFAETAIVPVAMTGFPATTPPTALSFLNEVDFPIHAVWRFCPLDPYTAKKAILKRRQKWASAGLNIRQLVARLFFSKDSTPPVVGPAEDQLTPAMARDADDALFRLERDETTLGRLTSTLLVFDRDRDRAVRRARQLVTELQNRGFVAWIETFNAPSAYLGSLPGVVAYNQRRPLTLARTWIDLSLTTSIWTGSATHHHPVLQDRPAHVIASTDGSTPFYLNLGHHDVQHAVVVGPTGSGKSVLVNTLLAQYFRYPEAQVFSIDKGFSLYATTLAARGHHYALSPDRSGDYRFAPLADVDDDTDRQRSAQWLEELVHVQGLEVTPERRHRLSHATELLAQTRNRTLASLATKLQDRELRLALAPYVGTGAHAHLFDGRVNPIRSQVPLHTFEMEEVLPLSREVVTPLLLHLFGEIERRLTGRPTLILLEEALNYLDDTLWSRRLTQWLYELRKKNAGVVFVSQTLSAFLSSGLRDAVLEGCPTKIFLPNPSATEPATAESYRTFGLNDRQIELVAHATPRRDYYLVSPAGSRLFQLGLSPAALAIFGLAGPADRKRIDRLVAAHPDTWLEELLGAGHPEFVSILKGTSHA